jgi:hypothetical protein
MKQLLTLGAILAVTLAPQQAPRRPASSTEAMYQAQADRCQRKFDHIRQNGSQTRPDQTPTVINRGELNAWFASGRVQLPTGVHQVRFSSTPGVVDATARVNFDEITARQQSSNPLLSLFSGEHDVRVVARCDAGGGEGHVHVQTVELDGTAIPRVALEFFLDHYVNPKHPEVGMDSTFRLPYRIDTATVGENELSITQK